MQVPMVSDCDCDHASQTVMQFVARVYVPATPHNPNPALRMTEPSSTSAMASSADLYNFEPPRLGFEAGVPAE